LDEAVLRLDPAIYVRFRNRGHRSGQKKLAPPA